MSSPIADLSYRNYDGPLNPPRLRWWAIARMMIKQGFSKKSTWVFSALSGWYYLAMIFVLFVIDAVAAQRPPGSPNPLEAIFGRIVWKDQFMHGFGFGQILFLVVSLILGAGAIANDNRANALLVYLSKPVSKLDYLIGKWFGVFLPLLLMMLIPSVIFYIYGVLSFRDKGFISQDPWLFAKLMIILPLGAAYHASLVVGISSFFKQGRIAGATYAGFYFLTNFFTQAMMVVFQVQTSPRLDGEGDPNTLSIVQKLAYGSIDGIANGMCKAILDTDGSPYFALPSQARMVESPPLVPVVGIMLFITVGMLVLAWTRIRAVEVVG